MNKNKDTIYGPKDYLVYAPLSGFDANAKSGQSITYNNVDASNFSTVDNVPCVLTNGSDEALNIS